MKNLFKILAVLGLMIGSANAQDTKVFSTFSDGATNQGAAADVFVPAGPGFGVITDLGIQSDVTGTKLEVYAGKRRLVTAGGVGASTNLYFSSTDAASIQTNYFLIIPKGTNYQLVQASSIQGTNVGLVQSQTVAVPIGSSVYVTALPEEKWTYNWTGASVPTNQVTVSQVTIWLPEDHASCVRATNVAAAGVKVFINGNRQK